MATIARTSSSFIFCFCRKYTPLNQLLDGRTVCIAFDAIKREGHFKMNNLVFTNDVLLQIFSFLDASSVLAAERVCSRWRRLIQENDSYLWKERYERYVCLVDICHQLHLHLKTHVVG